MCSKGSYDIKELIKIHDDLVLCVESKTPLKKPALNSILNKVNRFKWIKTPEVINIISRIEQIVLKIHKFTIKLESDEQKNKTIKQIENVESENNPSSDDETIDIPLTDLPSNNSKILLAPLEYTDFKLPREILESVLLEIPPETQLENVEDSLINLPCASTSQSSTKTVAIYPNHHASSDFLSNSLKLSSPGLPNETKIVSIKHQASSRFLSCSTSNGIPSSYLTNNNWIETNQTQSNETNCSEDLFATPSSVLTPLNDCTGNIFAKPSLPLRKRTKLCDSLDSNSSEVNADLDVSLDTVKTSKRRRIKNNSISQSKRCTRSSFVSLKVSPDCSETSSSPRRENKFENIKTSEEIRKDMVESSEDAKSLLAQIIESLNELALTPRNESNESKSNETSLVDSQNEDLIREIMEKFKERKERNYDFDYLDLQNYNISSFNSE